MANAIPNRIAVSTGAIPELNPDVPAAEAGEELPMQSGFDQPYAPPKAVQEMQINGFTVRSYS